MVISIAFVANSVNQGNKVWLNDGSGTFTDSGQSLGAANSWGAAMGDVDDDGDLDAFVTNTSASKTGGGQGNKVWINDGNGNFTDSGQSLGAARSQSVFLGDVDDDGDLDAFVPNGDYTNDYQANKVWINEGRSDVGDITLNRLHRVPTP